jgi:transcriptional regulator with XRE-family HTH domain
VATRSASEFGRLLRHNRIRAGLSQEQLADLAVLGVRTIRDLEVGQAQRPQPRTARLLAEALDLRGAPRDRFEEAASGESTSALLVPQQLPADIGDFVGREVEGRRLSRLLWRKEGSSALAVAFVTGRGGLGKTALAVHTAHELAAQFPAGQLYCDLGSSRAGPADPSMVPEGCEERASLFRTLLAGRRALVVLDDARDSAHVRPLLPGSRTCAVLITSRQRLTDLPGAGRVDLDPLEPEAALSLLAQVAGGDRVAAERAAAWDVVRRCGGLPLAVRIAGARLAARPAWSVGDLAGLLADGRLRLDVLRQGDQGVRAVMEATYRGLAARSVVGAASARAFRLLATLDVPDVSLPLAAVALGQDREQVREILETLTDVRLLESSRPGRYEYDELTRLFARDLAVREEATADRDAALERAVRFAVAELAADGLDASERAALEAIAGHRRA